jgi:DNA-binding response OmpR family regulator
VENRSQILVVEDEAPIRKLIRAALDSNKYRVVEADSGEEGLELLTRQQFDLLVLDLRLGGMSGWDVLDAMRAKGVRDRIRVMILTAQSAERDILRGWREGVDQYCMKPFEPAQFVKTVEAVLASSDEDLARFRKEELEKTQLLHLLDSAFEGP